MQPINNRQNGRRRGRNNNQRPQGGQSRGGGDSGNRIDSRARGNAAQLLEKYKNLAREAQLSGDRVQTEYYLQFADHYFRVLADSRSRQEEQRASRPDDRYDQRDDIDEGAPFGFGDEGEPGEPGDDGRDQPRDRDGRDRAPRDGRERDGRDRDGRDQGRPRRDRLERAERQPREDRGERDAEGGQTEDMPAAAREERPARREARGDARGDAGRSRRRPFGERDDDAAPTGIDAAVLPPAIGLAPEAPSPAGDAAEATEPAPRRRTRTRKVAADDSVAADD